MTQGSAGSKQSKSGVQQRFSSIDKSFGIKESIRTRGERSQIQDDGSDDGIEEDIGGSGEIEESIVESIQESMEKSQKQSD